MSFPLPHYLDELPADQAQKAKVAFLYRLAALYHNERGIVEHLSEAIGMNKGSLTTLINTGSQITPETAVKIEKLVGRDKMPREFFRPDLFCITEE